MLKVFTLSILIQLSLKPFLGLFFWNSPAEPVAYYFGTPWWVLCLWRVKFIFRKSIKLFRTKHTL